MGPRDGGGRARRVPPGHDAGHDPGPDGCTDRTRDDQRLKVVRADGTEVDVHRSVSGATPDGLLMPPPVLGRNGTSVYFSSSAKNLIAGTVDSNVNTHLYRLALR